MKILVNQAGYYGVERKIAVQRAEKYLKQLDLWEKRNDAARMLSGGMKRRVMIAKALSHEPKILFLDEPTAGVDVELRKDMWQLVRQLRNHGVTIILTTHYLEEAEMLCRNIAIIDSGIIVENTDMKSLLAKLDVETFVFDLKPNSAPKELDSLSSRVIDDHTLEVDVNKSQTINAIFTELNKQGLEVLSMRNKSNRLEELFVSLVGSGQAPVDSTVKE